MNDISLRIKELIDLKKMNISSFEKKIGVGNNSIGTIINRNSNVSGSILSKILNTFEDVSGDYLLTGKGFILKNEDEAQKRTYNTVSESTTNYSNQIDFKEKLIEVLQLQNSDLRNDKIELQKDKELLARIINNRPSKEKSA